MQNIVTASIVIFSVLLLSGVFLSLSSQIFELMWLVQFKRRLKAGIDSSMLTHAHFKDMTAAFAQSRSSALQALRIELGNSLEVNKKARCDFIRSLIDSHIAEDPFSELPENIEIQLKSIHSLLTGNPGAVPQLAQSLGDLYAKNRATLAKGRLWTVFGTVVGVLGFAVGLWQLYGAA